MAEREPLPPGSTIGILGGGQLGRMLAAAAAELGFATHVYAPDADSPAFALAAARTVAPYTDPGRLREFAAAVEVVTFEFENVPVAPLAAIADLVPLRPSPRALEIAQDRLLEKRFLEASGVPVAPWRPVDCAADLAEALVALGTPALLKTRRLGYDGKGQARIEAPADAAGAWEAIGSVPAVLERVVPFACECSTLVAVGLDGATAFYDMPRNVHRDGILRTSRVPGGIDPEIEREARRHAAAAAAGLGHVGVLAIEWFVVEAADGPRLLANEIAPRVHNSGHWTQDASVTGQFEQHVRAVCGWPLGDPRATGPVEMENLVGDDVLRWRAIAAEPGAKLHLYGKRERRPGRKMGHVNRLGRPPPAGAASRTAAS